LRIVHIAPNHQTLPPEKDGGTERIIHELSEVQVRWGHEVIIYAPKGSSSSGKVIPYPFNGQNEKDIKKFVIKTLPTQGHVDLIHDHTFRSVIAKKRLPIPTVSTLHLDRNNKVQHPVYVSKRALEITGGSVGDYVYNGLRLERLPLCERKEDYLLYMGRLVREKGIMSALDIAETTGRDLIIAGPIHDHKLFDQEIKPRLQSNPNLKYVGSVGGPQKQDLLKNASYLLFPIEWEEPFGIVMVEALACGTPVLALNKGSVSEVLAPFPGLMCDSVQEMIEKLRNDPPNIPPSQLRKYVLNQFTPENMAYGYMDIYKRVIAQYPVPELFSTVSARKKRESSNNRLRHKPAKD
jgi:glycosyltransferase involved in cell wall biosynthesis